MNHIIYYIHHNWLALLMVLIPSSLFLAILPQSSIVYYAWLLILATLAAIKNQRVSIIGVIFLIVCCFSILLGNAAPLFKSWERLGLFALLLMAYFPIFQSYYFDSLRYRSFRIMIFVILFTCIGSFIGYFFGVNFMGKDRITINTIETVGWFGGLTYHSMMLSPICAIALTTLTWALIAWPIFIKKKKIIFCMAFASFCCMMLTASRGGTIAGLVGTILIIFLKYRKHLGKLLQLGVFGIILAVILSPVYMPYANKVLIKQYNNELAGSAFASRENRWDHRLKEFSEYPIFGYGFSAIDTKYQDEYMPSTGIVETGSSWLAILSMTGIAGLICFFILTFSTITKLYRRYTNKNDPWALLHLGILSVFFVHFSVEGYIFAGGGALCFLFWFFFGCAYSYTRNPIFSTKINGNYNIL